MQGACRWIESIGHVTTFLLGEEERIVCRVVLLRVQELFVFTRELGNCQAVFSWLQDNIRTCLINDAVVSKEPLLTLSTIVVQVSVLQVHVVAQLSNDVLVLRLLLHMDVLTCAEGE